MKWLVDLDEAVHDEVLTAAQAEALKRRSRAEAAGFGIAVLLVGGVVATLIGLLALAPSATGLLGTGGLIALGGAVALLAVGTRGRLPATAAGVVGLGAAAAGGVWMALDATGGLFPAVWMGLALVSAGLALRKVGPAQLSSLGAWAAVIGGAVHLVGVFGVNGPNDISPWAMLDAAVLLLALGLFLDIRLLSALAVFALAGLLGETGYGRGSYFLAIYEPALAILLMSAVAFVGAFAAARLGEDWARHGRITGLVALVWVNMAFWVGSIWGDRPGRHLFGPDRAAFPTPEAYWQARRTYIDSLPDIPELAFVVLWAVLLLAVLAWSALTARRSVFNAAVTFAAIHFYTQWFERLDASPESIVAAGVIAILAAWGMVRINARFRAGETG
ncbi:MAG: hypothetical protein ACFBRM_13755 [Pikeienuella sp.]